MSEACKETGVVTDFADGNRIAVTVRRAEACHGCSAKNACFALGGGAEEIVLLFENTLNARLGDEVGLSLPEASIVKASAVLYLLPAVGLLCGAVLGARLAAYGQTDANTVSIIGSFIGLAAGFAVSRILSKRMSKSSKYRPRLSGIVRRADRGQGEKD